jgi:PAS domain S-box-containing protein
VPRRSSSDERKRVRRPAEARGRETAPPDLHISVALHERQMAQAQLRVQKYQDLYDRAPVGYLTLSDDGAIQESNRTAAALLGMEREELAGVSFERFLDRDEIDHWRRLLPSAIKTGEARTLRLGLRRPDGSSLPAHVTCQGTTGHDGRHGVRVVITDISEQVDVEEALRRSQERLSAVLDQFHDGYWEWSSATGETVVSGRVGSMLGVAGGGDGAELSLDPSWQRRVHPDDLQAVQTAMSDLRDGRRDGCDVELRWSMPSTGWKWIRVRGRILKRNAAGGASRVAGTVTDIDEAKQLREALRRLESRGASPDGMLQN